MEIRVGRVSKINYNSGAAEVTYPDKDGMVTQELPFLSSEYNMPNIDDTVLVAHLSSGAEYGVILGKFFTENNIPLEKGANVYRKDIDKDKCYIKYDKNKQELTFHSDKIIIDSKFKHEEETITVKDILTMREDIIKLQEDVRKLQEEVNILKGYH